MYCHWDGRDSLIVFSMSLKAQVKVQRFDLYLYHSNPTWIYHKQSNTYNKTPIREVLINRLLWHINLQVAINSSLFIISKDDMCNLWTSTNKLDRSSKSHRSNIDRVIFVVCCGLNRRHTGSKSIVWSLGSESNGSQCNGGDTNETLQVKGLYSSQWVPMRS